MAIGEVKVPWHLWVIGVLTLLWNGFGANDYLQTQLGNLDYIEGMTAGMDMTAAEVLAYYEGFPVWVHAAWALGVWGAVAGSILLLLRNRFAVIAFVLSLLGLIATSAYQYSVDIPPAMDTLAFKIFSAVIWIVTLLLIWYSVRMRRRGVLR